MDLVTDLVGCPSDHLEGGTTMVSQLVFGTAVVAVEFHGCSQRSIATEFVIEPGSELHDQAVAFDPYQSFGREAELRAECCFFVEVHVAPAADYDTVAELGGEFLGKIIDLALEGEGNICQSVFVEKILIFHNEIFHVFHGLLGFEVSVQEPAHDAPKGHTCADSCMEASVKGPEVPKYPIR